MRIAPVVVLLLLLCGVGICAESQPAETKPQGIKIENKTDTPNHHAEHKQRGTEESPLFVKITSGNCNIEPNNHTKGFWKNFPNENWFLVIVGIFQLGVFAWQAVCLRDTIKATEKTTKSLQDSERPYIFASLKSCEFDDSEEGLGKWKVEYTLKNHGKTPAILTNKQVFIQEKDRVKPIEAPEKEDIPQGGGVVGVGDEDVSPCIHVMDIGIAQSILAGIFIDRLFCYGRIDYKDIFGNSHHTKFCWVYQNRVTEKSFYLTPDKELNDYT
ncbi:MAG: hypothetical protein PHD54_07625 [Desulfuromonadaceae bacterium]|nr:hypothetical protein [Desulfuromonadaceae bacterium]